MRKEVICMSREQIKRHHVVQKVIEKEITIAEASTVLGLCGRQILRIKKEVLEKGPQALVHKNTGRKPSRAISDNIKDKIVELKKSELYVDANFTHFMELLEEKENIKISYTPLHRLLTSKGIKSPKKRRRKKEKHPTRERMKSKGLLVQIDATPFEWFKDGIKYSLHAAIDDATSDIVGAYIEKNECLNGYFEVTRQMLLNFGIPISMYADRHVIFKSPKLDKLSVEEELAGKEINDTQYEKALKELSITLIPAYSPQAKGRVERLMQTFQGRLITDFKVNGITTIAQANEFLPMYIKSLNEKFSVKAKSRKNSFRKLKKNINLDTTLCIKIQRQIDNGDVFSYKSKYFKVLTDAIPNKSKIEVLISPRIGVKVRYKDKVYETLRYIKPKKAKELKDPKDYKTTAHLPSEDHYYKNIPNKSNIKYNYETDAEILEMLDEIFWGKYADVRNLIKISNNY
jgi:transposase